MKTTKIAGCHPGFILLMLGAGALAGFSAKAQVTILGVQYRQDRMHPEFDCIWNNSNYPDSCPSNFPGANVHLFLRNDGAGNINVTNVTLAGYELKTIIKLRTQGQNDPYSIYYYWDDPPQAIFDAGEPVWFRSDPTNVPAGAVFQVVVRLRLVPVTQPISLGVMTDVGTVTTNIAVDASAPQLASVGFAPDLKQVYLHWRRNGGAAPTSVWMNGADVTSLTTTVADTNCNFGVSVITRTNALGYMSFNIFQGIFADGKMASAGLRAWTNNFNIGTYGMPPTTTQNEAKAVINDYENRGLNFTVYNLGSDGVVSLINKPEGQTYCAEHGFGFIPETPSQWNTTDPLGWYLRDEPDAHDAHITRNDNDTPPNLYLPQNNQHSVGVLAMTEIHRGDDLHYRQGKITPTVVNVDATYMPYNYFTYGQIADIGMSDPYYTSRQSSAYWGNTNVIPLYVKPYPYIYAVAQAMTEASEPNPSLIAMNSTGDLVVTNTGDWPYSTPEDIRMENYYAVAGGAKSLAYWWMLGGFGAGIITNAPAPTALWKGIGLCGNEFRMAQPLIVISHPAELPLSVGSNLWARTLLAGRDAVLLIVANDRYTNDINRFHYSPISNASVTVTLPSWFNGSATSFEIAEQAEGVKDVSTSLTGNQLQVNLGTVNLTRFIVVTTNAAWRSIIQQRYIEKSYQGVCAFAPDRCPAQATCILNADAEGGFRNRGDGVIANNWFEFEGVDGTNVVCYDETSIVRSGGHSQRIRVWKNGATSPGASGGVYQRIPALVGSNYTVSVWMAAGDTGSFCYLGVDRNGNTDPAAGTVSWTSAHNGTNWTQKSWTGNASNNFITVFYKVASTNGNKRNGYFDDATPACTSPVIAQNPAGTTNCPGATAYFTVAASGPGLFSYQWQRNGINLTDAGHYSDATAPTLTVSGFDSTDAGDYRCAVTTSYGMIYSSSAKLGVRAATTITQHPVAHDVCSGDNTAFTVAAVGDGALTYQWQKNLANLNNGGHYSGCTTATLTITGADASDVGNYRCVVTGGCGSSTSFQGALSLATAVPTITGHPTSKDICPGGNVNFAVTASGSGILTYQWQKNAANLSDGGHYSGATTATLTITGADASDVGSYRCVVANACGSSLSSSATLTIGATPSLLNGSFELENAAGVGTNWVAYQRSPNPTTVWSIQTNAPPSGAGLQYQQMANTSSSGGAGVRQDITGCTVGATYLISGWFRGNSSLATCTVKVSPAVSTNWATAVNLTPPATYNGTTWTNFSGTVIANATTMTLWLDGSTGGTGQNKAECFDDVTVTCVGGVPRPVVTGPPSPQTVCSGDNVSFVVTASGGGTLSYQWQTNGVSLSNNSHYAGATSATLWVTNVTSADAVNYACLVSNEGGVTNSSAAALTVRDPTTPTQQPAAQNLCAGANATFSVAATGDGTISYQWQTNGVNLGNNAKYAGATASTLWITNAQSADQVNYRCVVTAGCGSATSSNASLTLLAATAITQQPSARTNCPGVTTNFIVGATGQGALTYQWQTNGVNLSNNSKYAGATSATLWVTNTQGADAVNYRCIVTAGCGSVTSSVTSLTVKAATSITQQPTARDVCPGTTTNFAVTATGDGTLTYQWQTNGVNISNNSKYAGVTTATLWVTNAQSADQVNYRCVVTAGCGSANSSTAALTLKAVTAISGQPVSRLVLAGGTTNFTVTATGDALTYQWQKHSTNISNGGHYSGVTTATLTVSSADSSDAAPYRCVVTDTCGSATSSNATLTVCAAPGLLNASFEGSNVSGVATNWTGYQRAPNPTTVWTIQTASPPTGGGTQYQQIANTSSTGGGGVRQNITGAVVGCTYTVAGWMRGNSISYSTCTVKVSPTASTTWSTAVDLSPPQTYTGNAWTAFSGTVVATSTNMTLWLDGQTTGTGQNKAECFDAITVTCTP